MDQSNTVDVVAGVGEIEWILRAARDAAAAKDWNAQLNLLERCLKSDPANPRAVKWCRAKAAAMHKLGRFNEVDEVLRGLIERHGETPGDLGNLALAARHARRLQDAANYWARCIDHFPDHPAISNWRNSLASTLVELELFSEAEAVFARLATDMPNDPRGLVGLALVAQRSQSWSAAVERWDACISGFADPHLSWQRHRAFALQKLQRWKDAFDAWTVVASDTPTDRPARINLIRCFIRWAGATHEAVRMAAELTQLFPEDVTLIKIQASLAVERQEPEVALSLFLKCYALSPTDLSSLQVAMEMAVRMADVQSAERILQLAPDNVTKGVAYRCNVLLHYFRLTVNAAEGLTLIESVDDDEIDLACARSISTFLFSLGENRKLWSFCRHMLKRFPVDVFILHRYLVAVYLTKGNAIFEEEKAILVRSLPSDDSLRLLRSLNPSWLSSAEIIQVIDNEFDTHGERQPNIGLITEIGMRGDKTTLDYLASRIQAHSQWSNHPSLAALLAKVYDQRRLEAANLGSLLWNDFAEASIAMAQSHKRFLDQAIKSDLPTTIQKPALLLLSLLDANPHALVNSTESYYDAAELARWLVDRIRKRKPTSLIRLGDGEGIFLPYSAEDMSFRVSDQRFIQQLWWGTTGIAGASANRISSMFTACIAESDALGLPPPKRLFDDIVGQNKGPGQRGLCNILGFLHEMDPVQLNQKFLTSCHIHQDLHAWDLYRQILSLSSEVSVISCHNLAHTLADRFGVGVRQWVQIPPEQKYAGLFSDPVEGGEPFYPIVFDRVLAKLDVPPGEVFLVAAGFLGKLLCSHIRQNGGIAIDIGSVADLWMNYITRRQAADQIDLDMSVCLVKGQPFKDRFDQHNISAERPCRSDRTRRRNLNGRFNALFIEEPTPVGARYRLRLTGHPRCGSAYIAQAMQALGLEIGHERPNRDGICSWIHAVDDLNPPFGALPLPADCFRTTVSYVRDPSAAIPSILVEDCYGASFSFRRFHLARLLGIDIARRRTALERSVESYLGWMEMVDRQQPLCTLRVEHFVSDVVANKSQLSQVGIDFELSDMAAVSALPTTLNPSVRKSARGKPVITRAEYRLLPFDLLERLIAFCNKHEYRLPC
jgi:tetratricopeptide (TPR) repeat protein